MPDSSVPVIVAAKLIVPFELHGTEDGLGVRVVVVSTMLCEGGVVVGCGANAIPAPARGHDDGTDAPELS